MDIIDSSQQFTITLEIPPEPEGFAQIEGLTYPSSAEEGVAVPISFNLVNAGGDDVLFAQVTQVSPPRETIEVFRGTVASGASQPVTFNLTMPNQDLVIEIDIGHEES